MDFYEVLNKRKSVRGYKSDPVPQKALDKMAEALQTAPSACNLQPWSFRFVMNENIKADIRKCYTASWLAEAPIIIVALANYDDCWKRLEGAPIAELDMGIAMEHLVLAAAAEGLGTCWICAYEIEKMNKALNILPPWSAIAISPLGYPNDTQSDKPRKPTKEVFKIVP
ncbi:MAG: nitroreductase family protein [Victivallales bacterium]|nr:nitroreductase family protein [Victivallales bacterium]